MNEHTHSTEERGKNLHVLPSLGVGGPSSDLVVDLTGIRTLDLVNLGLLLTAQQNAQREDKAVWLAGVSLADWQGLYALGLGRLFKPFPEAEVTVA